MNAPGQMARVILRPKEVILIDDGFASYVTWQRYLSKSIYFYTNNRIFKFLLKILRLYKDLVNSQIILFSIYSPFINNKINLTNDFIEVKKKLKHDATLIEKNLVYLLGTKISERGGLYLEDELIYLRNVYNYWFKKGKKISYLAKRTSSDKKLKLIEKIGYEVKSPKYPLEIHLLLSKELPYYICGFGSSLFSTLPALFPELNYICTKFPTEKFNYKQDVIDYNDFVDFSKKSKQIEWIEV